MKLAGTVAGTSYDQLVTKNNFGTGGALLDLRLLNGFVPAIGNQFTIVDNTATGSGANGNAFAGLPDGSVFSADGSFFRINYFTTGDVVLTTVVPEPSAALISLASIGLVVRRRNKSRKFELCCAPGAPAAQQGKRV